MNFLIGAAVAIVLPVAVGLTTLMLGSGVETERSITAIDVTATMQATGIPVVALRAYLAAEAHGCPGLDWSLVAAVFAEESGHGGHGGSLLWPNGDVRPPSATPRPVRWAPDSSCRTLGSDSGPAETRTTCSTHPQQQLDICAPGI